MRNIIQKLKEKKGFTLVELIVVLVILAILAALLIPSLTGYIDKANEQKLISETRMIAQAIQVESVTAYALDGRNYGGVAWEGENDAHIKAIKKNSEVKALTDGSASFYAECDEFGALKGVAFAHGKHWCYYDTKTSSFKTGSGVRSYSNRVDLGYASSAFDNITDDGPINEPDRSSGGGGFLGSGNAGVDAE